MTNVYLGFDFGMKRIGVAVGQDITKTAKPLKTLHAVKGEPDWQEITQLIAQWSPAALIVGVPYNMDGTDQPVTVAARKFAEALGHKTGATIYEVDERLTTVAARASVFSEHGYKGLQDAQIDSVAAQLILQDWLTHLSE